MRSLPGRLHGPPDEQTRGPASNSPFLTAYASLRRQQLLQCHRHRRPTREQALERGHGAFQPRHRQPTPEPNIAARCAACLPACLPAISTLHPVTLAESHRQTLTHEAKREFSWTDYPLRVGLASLLLAFPRDVG